MCLKKKPNFFYGYWIVIVGFICFFIYAGVGFYAFGVFFKPIQTEFKWNREITSVAFTTIYVVQALVSPFIGKLVERFGPKKLITLGVLITGFGLVILSLTSNIIFFYAGYMIVGLGTSAVGTIPVSLLISSWFIKRRGMAMGLAATGVGAGGIVLAPIIGNILIPNYGWRTTYQILALLSVGLVVVTAQLLIKPAPQDVVFYSESIKPNVGLDVKKESLNLNEVIWSLNAALKTSTFWLIIVSFMLFNVGQVGTIQHLVNHLTDIGFSIVEATFALSLIGFGSALGKFFFGILSDWIAAKYCASLSFFLVLVAISFLIFLTPSSSPVLIWVFAFVLGLGIGGWVPLESILISSNFGLANYGTIFGVLSMFHNVSTGVGPIFFGFEYDSTQSYYWAFVSSVVMLTVAIAAILALQHPKLRTSSSNTSEN